MRLHPSARVLLAIIFQSTHPRGGRRYPTHNIVYVNLISIHAPTRGATLLRSLCCLWYIQFQSTHPRGVRRWLHLLFCHKLVDFNPRTHEGCDGDCNYIYARDFLFQSTHPRGVRLNILYYFFFFLQHFNPRTHEGCDLLLLGFLSSYQYFNPRTHEGCDTTT